MISDVLAADVEAIIRHAEAGLIRPRFNALADDDVHLKSPGEVVTVADEEAERMIAAGLTRLLPGVPVVGEEGCAADPARVDALRGDRAWLVDPIDGTGNFVSGGSDWAVMVALVEKGETVASWIWLPIPGAMYVTVRGGGVMRNGQQLRASPGPSEAHQLTGAVLTRFLDPETSERVATNRNRFGGITSGRLCAGVDYPDIVEGGQHFILFWRTLPWDHAPGALLLREAGGVASRLDGTPYEPGGHGTGLLAATDERTWTTVRDTLLGRPV